MVDMGDGPPTKFPSWCLTHGLVWLPLDASAAGGPCVSACRIDLDDRPGACELYPVDATRMLPLLPTDPADSARLDALGRLDESATVLLNALYDATGATDPDALQAWLDLRTEASGQIDERYPGVIHRLRLALAELLRLPPRKARS